MSSFLLTAGRGIIPGMSYSEYLTRQEAMTLLKISRSILDDLVRRGLPHIKLKRRVLFRRKDIDDFLRKHHLVKKHDLVKHHPPRA